ncbi:unnamed protein product, partial [Mesorhabditis spiculigera]
MLAVFFCLLLYVSTFSTVQCIETESPQSDAVPEQLDLSIVVLLVGMFAGCLVMVTLLIVCWMKLPMKDEFEPASEMTPSPSEKRKERLDFD